MIQPKVEIVGGTSATVSFEKMPGRLKTAVTRGMRKIGVMMERYIKTQKLSGQALQARTGNLRRSIFYRVGTTQDDAFVVVGADLEKAKYARVQELGGVIRPKRSANLAIPIGEARTRNGVARFTARDLIGNPGAFGYTGTFVRNRIIFGKKGQRIYPLFVLKPQVEIKAVGYLSGSVAEKRGEMVDLLTAELKAEISANGK